MTLDRLCELSYAAGLRQALIDQVPSSYGDNVQCRIELRTCNDNVGELIEEVVRLREILRVNNIDSQTDNDS